jgi:hypothetical protein
MDLPKGGNGNGDDLACDFFLDKFCGFLTQKEKGESVG